MNLPPDRFDPKTNQFHIFREIIVTAEEFDELKKKPFKTSFEKQLLACCEAIIEVVNVERFGKDVVEVIKSFEPTTRWEGGLLDISNYNRNKM